MRLDHLLSKENGCEEDHVLADRSNVVCCSILSELEANSKIIKKQMKKMGI